jgi:hypothetical protein
MVAGRNRSSEGRICGPGAATLLNFIGASVRTLQQVLCPLYFHFLSENFSEDVQLFAA